MKRILFYTFVGLVGVFIALKVFWWAYDQFAEAEQVKSTYCLSAEEKAMIQDGDLVMRYGYGLVSDYIVDALNEPFCLSHCGFVHREGDSLIVIHSESSSYLSFEGIQTQDFDDFVKNSRVNSVVVVRFKPPEGRSNSDLIRGAEYYLKKKMVFDYGFNMQDSSTMYCSEIIWHVFKNQFGVDVYEVPGREYTYSQFRNFYNSPNFSVVLNHQYRGVVKGSKVLLPRADESLNAESL